MLALMLLVLVTLGTLYDPYEPQLLWKESGDSNINSVGLF